VGKTAIAEGLARRIVEMMCRTYSKMLMYIRWTWSLLAGTKYRGDFDNA